MVSNRKIDIKKDVPKFILVLIPKDEISDINTKGYNSDVIVVGKRLVVKVIGRRRCLVRQTISANKLGTLIHQYHAKLKEISAEYFTAFCEWSIIPQSSTNPNDLLLLVASPYEGIDLEEALRKEIVLPKDALTSLFGFLKVFFLNINRKGQSSIGIDPKPANFCLRIENSKIVFIDFVPPRFKDENGKYWIELKEVKNINAQKYGVWKHYTINGIIANLLFQLSRIMPEGWEFFLESIVSWLKNEGYFKNAKWLFDQINLSNSKNTINKIDNLLILRLVGCRLLYENQEYYDHFKYFFSDLTHYEDGELQPRLKKAKSFLYRFIHND